MQLAQNQIYPTDQTYQISVTPYRRNFRRALQTSHGVWAVREGAIISLTDSTGQVSQGEIAPLAWFGSERLSEAIDFCDSLDGSVTTAQISAIPDRLPCCQFAFETALSNFVTPGAARDITPTQIAALLPTGGLALSQWENAYQRGHRTFKWKIGTADIDQEQQWWRSLITQLPANCKLRLDANAGLSRAAAIAWLELIDRYAHEPTAHGHGSVEWLEQPLGVGQFRVMQALSEQYVTPLALDESIANLAQIQTCYAQGWRGVYVVKPAIVGSPQRLLELVKQLQLDVVGSSVFETTVGYSAALNLSQMIQNPDRAYGFGTQNWW